MQTQLSYTTHKAKKQHRCDWCCQKIEVGEVYNYSTHVCDGHFFVWKNHERCEQIANKLKMFDEADYEGLTSDDFQESIIDAYARLISEELIPEPLDDDRRKSFSQMLEIVCNYHLSPKTN